MKFDELLKAIELQDGFTEDTEIFVYPSMEKHSEANESIYHGKYNDLKDFAQYRLYANRAVKSWEVCNGYVYHTGRRKVLA